MKKLLMSLCCAVTASISLAEGIAVVAGDVRVERTGSGLAVGMTLDLTRLPIKTGMSLTVTPVLSAEGGDRLELPAVTVAGRTRYYNLLREGDPVAAGFTFRRHSKDMAPLDYAAIVPYREWMDDVRLTLEILTEGCCSRHLGTSATEAGIFHFGLPAKFEAEYAYVTPDAEAVKVRETEGKAYVDFRVNSTDIVPDYGNNPVELAKIRESVEAIRENPGTKIRSLTITGYASPEGSYANNGRLARGRTEAVAGYVSELFSFPEGTVETDYVAEDWDGVRRFLEENPGFEHCEALLAIVDSDADPDAKDSRIRREYPSAYRYLLGNVYPPLRHTDYRIEYEVRSYTTAEEIAEVFRSRPCDLSLQEMFLLAGSYPEGSPEYYDILMTAVRSFPDSEVAALNAAFAQMQREEYTGAAQSLAKAGDSPEAIYARGILCAFTGDYAVARRLLNEARSLGVPQAEGALQNIDKITTNK